MTTATAPRITVILGHDVELFVGEIEDTGAWEHFRQALGADFKQSGLFS